MLEIIPCQSQHASQVMDLLFSCFHKDFVIMFGKKIEKGKELLTAKFTNAPQGIFIAREKETSKLAGVIIAVTQDRISNSRKLSMAEIFKNFGFYGFRVWLGNFIETEKVRQNTCYMEFVAVSQDFRNQGLGWKLLETARQHALGKNGVISRLTLWVMENNASAIHLYEKFGFKKIRHVRAEILEKILGEKEGAYFMEMKLA